MTRALSVLVALLLFAMPSAAAAKTAPTNAPPGNSAIDEYLETVPSATGNAVPRPPGTGSKSSALTPAQRAKLEKLGPDGKALIAAVDATAPPRTAKPSQKLTDVPAAEGRSPLSSVIDATIGRDDGGGMGIVLPAILLATLLGFIALVVMRRRSVS